MDFRKGETVTVFDKTGAMQYGIVQTNFKEINRGRPGAQGYIVKLLGTGGVVYARDGQIFKPW